MRKSPTALAARTPRIHSSTRSLPRSTRKRLALTTLTMATALVAAPSAFAQTPQSPWTHADVGAVSLTGSATGSAGTFNVAGAGADISGTADGFHFLSQRLNGNGQIVARVASVQNTNAAAKAGLMIREDGTAGARNVLVALTPSSGVTFQSRTAPGATTSSSAQTGLTAPQWLKLARSGNQFTAFRSPDGVTWTAVGAARVVDMAPSVLIGLAVSSHNTAALATGAFTNVQLVAPQALFVVGGNPLGSGDAVVSRRLQALGYAVTVKTAGVATIADATGKDLIAISSSVTSGQVANKFTTAAVPLIVWENALLDDLGMTGTVAGTDYGTMTAQTQALIASAACDRSRMYTSATAFADGCHDLAGGLSGTVALTKSGATFTWGRPGAASVKIATLPSDANKAVVFAYDKGAAMPGLAAPARRVALFLDDTTATLWTARGQILFDNAVYWATGTRFAVTKKVLSLNYDPILRTQGNVRLHAYASSSNWGWSDPMVLLRDYLADLTEASGGYVRWQLAQFSDAPTYLDAWLPITGSTQFKSPAFTEQNFLDAYQYAASTGDWVGATARMPSGGNYQTDYTALLNTFNVDARVTAGQVDEVVVYGHAYGGLWEAAMAGRNPYNVNGGSYVRNAPNYVVMGLNYERGLSEALESFGHRAEHILDRVYGLGETLPYNVCYYPDSGPSSCGAQQTPSLANVYDRFSVVDANVPGQAAVGAAHWAPNAQLHTDEYHWDLTNSVYSQADDWLYNFPRLVGSSTRRLMSSSEWLAMTNDGNYGRGFKRWWLNHMPRTPGLYADSATPANDNHVNNWWEYMINFNNQPETR